MSGKPKMRLDTDDAGAPAVTVDAAPVRDELAEALVGDVEPPKAVSAEPVSRRAQFVQQERRQRSGDLTGMRRKRLTPSVEIPPTHVARWVEVTDTKDEVAKMERFGDWARVTNEEARPTGHGGRSVLMVKPKDWYDEDRRQEEEGLHRRRAALRDGHTAETPSEDRDGPKTATSAVNGLYVGQYASETSETPYTP